MVDSDDWENDIDDQLADEPKKEETKVETKTATPAAAADSKFANEDDIDSEEEELKRKEALKKA